MSGGEEFGTVASPFPTLLSPVEVNGSTKAKRKDSIMADEQSNVASRKRRREYCAENVVLVEVPWESVYRRGSGELVRRERSLEAEREVGAVVLGDADFGVDENGEKVVVGAIQPPDYFVDRWCENYRSGDDSPDSCRMVSVIVYDDAKMACEFRRLMKLREKAGGCCKVLDDEEWASEEAKYLNEEWARLRKVELENAEKVIVDACVVGGIGQRVLVARIVGDGVKEGKVVKDALSNAVSGCAEPFMVTAVEDEVEEDVKWIVVGAKRKGFADCDAFLKRVWRNCDGMFFALDDKSNIVHLTDTALIACSSMCSALSAHDNREEVRRKAREARAAANAEKAK